MSLRYPVGLGALCALLVFAAGVGASAVSELSAAVHRVYSTGFASEADFQRAHEAVAQTQVLVTALTQVIGPLLLSAVIAGIGALVLLVVRSRRALD